MLHNYASGSEKFNWVPFNWYSAELCIRQRKNLTGYHLTGIPPFMCIVMLPLSLLLHLYAQIQFYNDRKHKSEEFSRRSHLSEIY